MLDLCKLNCLEVKCLQMWLGILTGNAMHFDKLNVLQGGGKLCHPKTPAPSICDLLFLWDCHAFKLFTVSIFTWLIIIGSL